MILQKIKYLYVNFKSIRNALIFNRKHSIKVILNDEEFKLLKILKTKGFVVVENYYTKEQCDELITEVDRLLIDYPQFTWKDDFGADKRIYGANRISTLIDKYYSDPFLTKMANAFNEMETINNHTLAGKIEAKENNIGSGQGWHRDSVNPYQFKSILYLSDVDIDHGPFEFLEGTDKIRSIFEGIWNVGTKPKQYRITTEIIDKFVKSDKYKRKILTGKAGTLILVNTFGIHRGMPINKGVRFALTNYFFSKMGLNETYFENKFNLPPIQN